jgi:hypothetical protein
MVPEISGSDMKAPISAVVDPGNTGQKGMQERADRKMQQESQPDMLEK